MAQQNFWEQDQVAQPPTGGGGPKLIVAPQKKAPSGYDYNESGNLVPIRNGPADPYRTGGELDTENGKATESQAKSASFLGRMVRANTAWSQVPEDERGPRGNIRQTFHDIAPGLENSLLNSDLRQVADQNVEDFIAASLRQESGASINKDEFNRQYRIFFPMPGDGPEVIKQKALAREQAIEGFKLAAGPLADEALATIKAGEAPQSDATAGTDGAPLKDNEFVRGGVAYYRDPQTGEESPLLVGGSMHPEDKQRLEEMKANSGAGTSAVMGAGNVLTFGFGDEIDAGLNAFAGAMQGKGSFSELYGRNEAVNKAYEKDLRDRHGVAYVAGQLVAGLAIPSGAQRVASRAAAEALAAGATEAQASRAAAGAAAMRLGKEGAAGGAAYGAGDADGGIEDRIVSAAVGAAIGGTVGAGVGRLTGGSAAKPAAVDGAKEMAQAGADLNVRIPKFVLQGERGQNAASAYGTSPFGATNIRQGADMMLDDAQAARGRIVDSVGAAFSDPVQMGDAAVRLGKGAIKAARNRIGVIYKRARNAAQDELVPPTETMQTLSGLIREERAVPGGTKVGGILEHYADAFDQGGPMSIEGARKMRTELRSRLRDESGLTPDAADRLTAKIMDSVGKDIENGLRAAGKDGAIPLYREADKAWAQWLDVEDDVLKPYLGKDLNDWGSNVAKKLINDFKGNGERLQQFLSAVPEDEANRVRATLIERLGRASDGSQNAEGTAFSLDSFLTNWNMIKDTRGRIFSKETNDALGKLAVISEGAKAASKARNHSNTGRSAWKAVAGALSSAGGGASLATGDVKYFLGGLFATGLGAAKQYGASKLLASPQFAKKLVATPANPQAAYSYWSRPWVASMARTNPQIAAELFDVQRAILSALNDNVPMATRAAASNGTDAEGEKADQK